VKITEIEPNVDLIEVDGRAFYLIGTAHVSKDSADLVDRIIREKSPDTVCLELCDSRFETLSNPERWKDTDIYTVIKSGRAYVLMAQLALSAFQKKLAEEFRIRPGEEMHRAMAVCRELEVDLSLVDREVRITLKRAWAKASFFTLIKMVFGIIFSLFSPQKITEEEIEKLKATDQLTMMIDEFSGSLPGVKVALIDERDRYLAAKILASPGESLVAVVGAAHVPGIKQVFGSEIDVAKLEELPPPKKTIKIIGWGVPIVLAGLITAGFIVSGRETTEQMIIAWILANGVFASIGTIIA
jgi:pheromone shutdown-related protein TraB